MEDALKAHASIFDALVVGTPDPRWGNRVLAVVQLREGRELSLDAIQTHCRKHIACYKIPRALVLVDKIPRSPSGKIVLAEFTYGGKVAPSFPSWLIDGTRPSRLAWLLKERILPPLYWKAMLKGREWMAKPELADR